MGFNNICVACQTAINNVVSSISQYAVHPSSDFTRNRQLPANSVMTHVITLGGKSSKNELRDFCACLEDPPSAQAMLKQRAKLKAEGVKAVLHELNRLAAPTGTAPADCPWPAEYRFLAADGSTFVFPSDHRYADDEYLVQSAPDQRGIYSMHLTALSDMKWRTYADGTIQPIHQKNERLALCELVDDYAPLDSSEKTVIVADRGFESYNVLAHIIEQGDYFVIRVKDVDSEGILRHLDLPQSGEWDREIDMELTWSRSKKIKQAAPVLRRLDKRTAFDYLDKGTINTYRLRFRVVRLDIDGNGTYECLITNLPKEGFPIPVLKQIYGMRWGIEVSFRELKYTIGAIHFHAARPELVKQEIYGALIAYNVTELLAQEAAKTKPCQSSRHYQYRANFSECADIAKKLLRHTFPQRVSVALRSMQREMVPVRPGRHSPRAMENHKRRRSYFTYRSA